jgi:hypothetical protein
LPNNGAIGRFGSAAPGSLIGPGSLVLSVKIPPNLGVPNRNVSVPQFGRITSTQGVENAGARNHESSLRRRSARVSTDRHSAN